MFVQALQAGKRLGESLVDGSWDRGYHSQLWGLRSFGGAGMSNEDISGGNQEG